MQLEIGQIVASRAGRDITRWFVVVGVEQDRVLLANGEKRSIAQPKRKNIQHIAPTTTILLTTEYSTDAQMKKALAAYVAAREPQTQGG